MSPSGDQRHSGGMHPLTGVAPGTFRFAAEKIPAKKKETLTERKIHIDFMAIYDNKCIQYLS